VGRTNLTTLSLAVLSHALIEIITAVMHFQQVSSTLALLVTTRGSTITPTAPVTCHSLALSNKTDISREVNVFGALLVILVPDIYKTHTKCNAASTIHDYYDIMSRVSVGSIKILQLNCRFSIIVYSFLCYISAQRRTCLLISKSLLP